MNLLETKFVDVTNSALDNGPRKPDLVIGESLRFAYDTFLTQDAVQSAFAAQIIEWICNWLPRAIGTACPVWGA